MPKPLVLERRFESVTLLLQMSMSGGSHLISGHPSFCFSLIPLNTDPYPGIFYNIVDNFLRLTVQELDIRHRLYSL